MGHNFLPRGFTITVGYQDTFTVTGLDDMCQGPGHVVDPDKPLLIWISAFISTL